MDLRQLEQVVDHRRQVVDLRAHLPVEALRIIGHAVFERLGHGAQARRAGCAGRARSRRRARGGTRRSSRPPRGPRRAGGSCRRARRRGASNSALVPRPGGIRLDVLAVAERLGRAPQPVAVARERAAEHAAPCRSRPRRQTPATQNGHDEVVRRHVHRLRHRDHAGRDREHRRDDDDARAAAASMAPARQPQQERGRAAPTTTAQASAIADDDREIGERDQLRSLRGRDGSRRPTPSRRMAGLVGSARSSRAPGAR